MLYLDVCYTVKQGKRQEFLNEIINENIPELVKKETGCCLYEFKCGEGQQLLLAEKWLDSDCQKQHLLGDAYKKLSALKQKYVLDTSITKKEI